MYVYVSYIIRYLFGTSYYNFVYSDSKWKKNSDK